MSSSVVWQSLQTPTSVAVGRYFDEGEDELCNHPVARWSIVLLLLVRDHLRPGGALGTIHGRRGEGLQAS